MGRDVRAVGHRQLAARGGDPVADNDHRAVVQRGILEEDVHDEPAVDLRVEAVARVHELVHRGLVLDDDEGAGLFRRHGPHGLHQFLHAPAPEPLLLDAEEAVEQVARAAGNARLHGHAVQQVADFRLEDDDDRQDTHVQQGAQQHRHHPHVQGRRDGLPHQEQGQHQHDVQHRGVAPDAPQQEIDQQRDHPDVQDVRPAELQESEYAQHLRHTGQSYEKISYL